MTKRFFDGGRGSGGMNKNPASELMKIEIQKKGKLPSADRYKFIFKKKLEESRKKALEARKAGIGAAGTKGRVMSKRAEQALKELAAKKASKEAKALRRMVIVQPRTFPNGRIVKNGKIFDIAGNIVAQVNTKNGKMATMGGWALGRYKPKSYLTELAIQEAINKYSPYYINLRKMQAMQQNGEVQASVWGGQESINLPGTASRDNVGASLANFGYGAESYGSDAQGPRQNVGMTAWGARSDNVWGTWTDNAWGVTTDNVWGTNSSDVWGGIGGSPFGSFAKTVQIWGTGNGKNYLRGVTKFLSAFFGIKNKSTRNAFAASVKAARARSVSSGRSGGAPVRAPSAPSGRR